MFWYLSRPASRRPPRIRPRDVRVPARGAQSVRLLHTSVVLSRSWRGSGRDPSLTAPSGMRICVSACAFRQQNSFRTRDITAEDASVVHVQVRFPLRGVVRAHLRLDHLLRGGEGVGPLAPLRGRGRAWRVADPDQKHNYGCAEEKSPQQAGLVVWSVPGGH